MRDESGTTFVEILIAVVIMSTVIVAVIGGMGASTAASGTHRQQAEAHAILVNAVERLKSSAEVAYVPCATTTNSAYLAAARNVTVPTGFTTSGISITDIKYWDAGATTTQFYSGAGNCKDNLTDASGNFIYRLQLITLSVTSSNGAITDSLSLIKAGGS